MKEPEAVIRMHQAIMDKIAAIPGVTSVGLTILVPMTGSGWHDPIFAADKNYEQNAAAADPAVQVHVARPAEDDGRTRLIAGRDFTWDGRLRQAAGGDGVRRTWRASCGAAVGGARQTDSRATARRWREVVGVVSDERDEGVDKKAPTIAVWPMLMTKFEGDDVHRCGGRCHTIRSPRAGSSGVHQRGEPARVWSVNPNLPLAGVRTLDAVVSDVDGADVVHAGDAGDCRARWRCCWASPASTA